MKYWTHLKTPNLFFYFRQATDYVIMKEEFWGVLMKISNLPQHIIVIYAQTHLSPRPYSLNFRSI